jgi:hypothetical protein
MKLSRIDKRLYQRAVRARCKAKGLCVDCTLRPALKGTAPNGAPYSRCRLCIDDHAKFNARYVRRQRRALRSRRQIRKAA